MVKDKEFELEADVSRMVSAAIDNTAIEDEEVDNYHEAAVEVLTQQMQAKTAASQYKVDQKQLEMLIQLAQKRLDTNNKTEQSTPPNHANDTTENTTNKNGTGTVPQQNNNDSSTASSEDNNTNNNNGTIMENGDQHGQQNGVVHQAEAEKAQQQEKKPKSRATKNGRKEAEKQQQLEKPKRKRRSDADMLLEAAREDMFNGKDPNELEREALSLVLSNNGGLENEADEDEEEAHQEKPRTTRSGRSIDASAPPNGKLKALTWRDRDDVTTSSSSTTTVSTSGKNTLGSRSTTSNSNNSMALVVRPKRSMASTSIAQASPASRTTPSTAATNKSNSHSFGGFFTANNNKTTPPTNVAPNINNMVVALRQNNNNSGNAASGRRAPRPSIPTNARWKEFAKVTDEVFDEVLSGMHARNADELAKKAAMKLGLEDILFNGLSQVAAHKAHAVGLSTIRHYCKEVKQRLEQFLGDGAVSERMLRQFEGKDKARVTLAQYRQAMVKAGIQPPPELEKKHHASRKRPAQQTPPGSAGNSSSSNRAIKGPTAPKRPRTSQRGVKQEPVTPGKNEFSATPNGQGDNNNKGSWIMASLAKNGQTGQMRPLQTAPRQGRRPLRGTPQQIREQINEHFQGKFQGSPEVLSKHLTNWLVMESRVKRALARDDFPMEIVMSGYYSLGRAFQVETIEVIEDVEEDDD